MATKTRLLDYKIDPTDVQRSANESYEGMTSVIGVTNVMNTLSETAKHFHLKEEKRSMINVDRQLNKIDAFYTRQFSKMSNYTDDDRMAELNSKYEEELKGVESYVTEAGFTKSTRTQAMAKVNATGDKVGNVLDSGLDVKQMQDDINTIVGEQSELSSSIAMVVHEGIKDPDQIDDLMNQYYDNIKQREDMGLISSVEGKSEFSALFGSTFDQGTLVKALQVIDDNPMYADMTDPEVVLAKKNAQASVLEQFDVELAMNEIKKATSGDKYKDYIDMNQLEIALSQSHKRGERSNLKLLGQLEAWQKKVDADSSRASLTAEKSAMQQELKESYAERDLWTSLANGMSFVEAEDNYRATLDLPPKYKKPVDWLHDSEYLMSISGTREVPVVEGKPEMGTKTVPNITPEILANIDNDVTLQYGFLGATKMTEIETMWNDPQMPLHEKYNAINNLLITTLNGDMTMLPYVMKEASGKIGGLDKGMLYTTAFPDSGNSGQIRTYEQTNQGMVNRANRSRIREEEFALRQEAYTTSGKGKKIDLYNDRKIELAQREAEKGIALTKDNGVKLYKMGKYPSYRTPTNSYQPTPADSYSTSFGKGYGATQTTSFGVNTGSDTPQGRKPTTEQGVFSPQAIGEVLNEFKISREELNVTMADGSVQNFDAYKLSEMIYNEVQSDNPFVIDEINGYILDAYTEMTGKVSGTDVIQGLEDDRQWGYVGIGDVSTRVSAEGMRRYVRQKVMQLARPQDTPNPEKTSEPVQQFNFLGVTQY